MGLFYFFPVLTCLCLMFLCPCLPPLLLILLFLISVVLLVSSLHTWGAVLFAMSSFLLLVLCLATSSFHLLHATTPILVSLFVDRIAHIIMWNYCLSMKSQCYKILINYCYLHHFCALIFRFKTNISDPVRLFVLGLLSVIVLWKQKHFGCQWCWRSSSLTSCSNQDFLKLHQVTQGFF